MYFRPTGTVRACVCVCVEVWCGDATTTLTGCVAGVVLVKSTTTLAPVDERTWLWPCLRGEREASSTLSPSVGLCLAAAAVAKAKAKEKAMAAFDGRGGGWRQRYCKTERVAAAAATILRLRFI